MQWEIVLSSIIILIVGFLLGRWTLNPNIDICEDHYKDMKILVNQYSDLSAKLISAMMQQPVIFKNKIENIPEIEDDEGVDTSMSGGRL